MSQLIAALMKGLGRGALGVSDLIGQHAQSKRDYTTEMFNRAMQMRTAQRLEDALNLRRELAEKEAISNQNLQAMPGGPGFQVGMDDPMSGYYTMGMEPRGVESGALQTALKAQPQPEPLPGKIGEIQWLQRMGVKDAVDRVYPLKAEKTTGGKESIADQVFMKRIGQTKKEGKLEGGVMTEREIPFSIQEAQAAADSVRALMPQGTGQWEYGGKVGQPTYQTQGTQRSFDTWESFQAWLQSPEGRTHPNRGQFIQQAKIYFGK